MTSLAKWNPFEATFPKSFEEFFSDLAPLRRPGWFNETQLTQFTPEVSLTETPESYVVKAEVPGVPAEEIKVDVHGNRLTISGEKKREEKREEEHSHIYERSYGSFTRSFTFPGPVDAEKVDAETEDGVLTITVGKSKEATGRRISVTKKDK